MRYRPGALLFLAIALKPSAEPPASMSDLVAQLGAEDPDSRALAKEMILSRTWEWTADDLATLQKASNSTDAEIAVNASTTLHTLTRRRRLAELMTGVKGWDRATVMRGNGDQRRGLLETIFLKTDPARVPEEACELAAALAVQESWLGEDTEKQLIGFARGSDVRPCCRGMLVRLCSSPDYDTAVTAAMAAAWCDVREAAPAVCRLLERNSDGSKTWDLEVAASTLEAAKDPVVMKNLAASVSTLARGSCTRLIARGFATERADVLLKLLGDQNPSVRRQAASAICVLGLRTQLEPLLMFITADQKASIEWVPEMERYRGMFDAKLLAEMCEDEDLKARKQAARLLAWAREPHVLLGKLLQDPSHEVRYEAAAAALAAGDARVIASLIPLLDDSSFYVQEQVSETLGTLRAMEAIPEFRKRIKSNSTGRVAWLWTGLARIGDPSTFAELIEAIRDDTLPTDPKDRFGPRAATDALGLIGGTEALARLRGLKGDERIVRSQKLSLGFYGEPQDLAQLEAPMEDQGASQILEMREAFRSLMGRMFDDLPVLLRARRESLFAEALALNARFATNEQVTEDLVGLLTEIAREDGRLADRAQIALVALGRASKDEQKRIVRRVRANFYTEDHIALCEALARAHEPDAWAAWAQEAPADREVSSGADVVALMKARGIELEGPEPRRFMGRIAKGQVVSLRRLTMRFQVGGPVMFDGPKLKFIPAEEALRIWAYRLEK